MAYLKHCEVETRVDHLTVDIQEVCKSYSTIKYWAYIYHDKDDTENHVHIYLNFGKSGVNTSEVAKWFNLPEQQVQKIKGRRTDILKYLIHANDSARHKHQYNPSEVIANFDFSNELALSDIIGNFKDYSYAQMLAYVNTLLPDERKSVFQKLEILWKCHCKWSTLQTDRKIDVIFITGKAGTGKTYYAKKLCDGLGYDYCISSSKNDLMQDYLGQKALILDDLRYTNIDFTDLLKVLDNNTSSSYNSRYSNKVFNGKLIIITSSVPLSYWYPVYRISKDESLIQLYRRIGSYVEVNKEKIVVYNNISDEGRPIGKSQEYVNELSSLVNNKEENSFNVFDAFDKVATLTKINSLSSQLVLVDEEGLPF